MTKSHDWMIVGLALSIGIFSLSQWMCASPAAGPAAAGDEAKPIKIDRLVLYDMHGLWGGRNVFVSRDGTLWVQVSRPAKGSGFEEQRFKLKLKPEQLAELEKILADHHFIDIQIKERPGIPDETRPTIHLTPVDGKIVKKSKWNNDVNADFTAVYLRLLELVPKEGSETPVYKGKWDYEWVPEGFKR